MEYCTLPPLGCPPWRQSSAEHTHLPSLEHHGPPTHRPGVEQSPSLEPHPGLLAFGGSPGKAFYALVHPTRRHEELIHSGLPDWTGTGPALPPDTWICPSGGVCSSLVWVSVSTAERWSRSFWSLLAQPCWFAKESSWMEDDEVLLRSLPVPLRILEAPRGKW